MPTRKTHIVVIYPVRRSNRGTVYRAKIDGEYICDSVTPLFATARRLLNEELYHGKDKLVMRHRGSDTDCFKPITIEAAAKLTVSGDKFAPFVEFDKEVFA